MRIQIEFDDLPDELRKRRHGNLPFKVIQFDYWQVEGQSWRGNPIKRDGKRVNCGHEHKSEEACNKCLRRMKKEKPGKCHQYTIRNIKGYLLGYKNG
jgi:hypothetical protein